MGRFKKIVKLVSIFISTNSIIRKWLVYRTFCKFKLNFFIDYFIYFKSPNVRINQVLNVEQLSVSEADISTLEYVCNMYINHRFNVLGSGWVSADFNSQPIGFQGNVYMDYKKDGLNELSDANKNYIMIDWHKDIKSGFRFDKFKDKKEIFKNIPEGVDIKMPWELSRMYHLPQMALLALKKESQRKEILNEFKAQINDFQVQNVIGLGVHYINPMEVAIRMVNVLVAYDILIQIDEVNILDENFKKKFNKFIINNGRYIIYNLENDILNSSNGNHYLSNLCGVIFISSYLKNAETKKWYRFAVSEFKKEFMKQFLDDGGNFECSTAYHRLSAEISTITIAVLINQNEIIEKFIIDKLNKIIDFSLLTRTKSGEIIQIGDNDSGRLLKLIPKGKFYDLESLFKNNMNIFGIEEIYDDQSYFEEDELLTDSLISYAYPILQSDNLIAIADKNILDQTFINSLVGEYHNKLNHHKLYSEIEAIDNEIDLSRYSYKKKSVVKIESANLEDVKLKSAPEFGLYVFENDNFQLYVRGIPNYDKMRTGHSHCDYLHFEIIYNENKYLQDPGSYVYTASRENRDFYRSSKAHNIPIYEIMPCHFIDFFKTDINLSGKVVKLTNNEIGIKIQSQHFEHYRNYKIMSNKVIISDFGTTQFQLNCNEHIVKTRGYGKREKNKFYQKDIFYQEL